MKRLLRTNKLARRASAVPLSLLPDRPQRVGRRWMQGRREYRKLRLADGVIVSFPASGRTWLRVMLTRFYQTRFELPRELELLGLKNLHRKDPRIPRVFFTHDHFIRHYTGNRDTKLDFAGKRVVLLVRDPRDVAVSSYHAKVYRGANPLKKGLREFEISPDDPPALFEYIRWRVPRVIDFLNGWQRELARRPDLLVVRYEDLLERPAENLRRVVTALGSPSAPAEIETAVAFGRFDEMKQLEAKRAYGGDRRVTPGDPGNPESYKTRRGKAGGYRDYLSPDERAEIDSVIASRLSRFFGYGEGGAVAPLGGASASSGGLPRGPAADARQHPEPLTAAAMSTRRP